MGGAVILNWVLGAVVFVAVVGGGVYAIFRHGMAGPNTGGPPALRGQGRPQRHAPG